jgi:hypothetical protein
MTVSKLRFAVLLLVFVPAAFAQNPFTVWKRRIFGPPTPPVVDAPRRGVVQAESGHPVRIRIEKDTPRREFPEGASPYRIVELPHVFEHAALRVRVTTRRAEHGRGHTAFQPQIYLLDDDDGVRKSVAVAPLHIDIRPLKRTRLLGCIVLDHVRRFAVATTSRALQGSYESDVREATKAPSKWGFYYATDAVRVKLPYVDTGDIVLDVTETLAPGKGC